MKKIAMILVIGLISAMTFAATEEIIFSEKGYENAVEMTTVTSGDVTITFSQGTGGHAPTYYTSGMSVRAYSGNTITISSSVGQITLIRFSFGVSDKDNEITADKGVYSDGSWIGEEGSVTFSIGLSSSGSSSGQRRIAKITVVTFDASATTKVFEGENLYCPILFTKAIGEESIGLPLAYDLTVNSLTSHLYIWDETYKELAKSSISVINSTGTSNDGYKSYEVKDRGWAGMGYYYQGDYINKVNDLIKYIQQEPEKYHIRFAIRSADNASHAFQLFDQHLNFTLGQKQHENNPVYGDFERDGLWHNIDIPFSYFADSLKALKPISSTSEGTNLFCILSEGKEGAIFDIDNICIYKGKLELPTPTTYTMRFNSFSVNWTSAYVEIWEGSEYGSSANDRFACATTAPLTDDGWYTVTVQGAASVNYYVSWSETATSSSYYFFKGITESSCFEYDESAKKIECRNLMPDEQSTVVVDIKTTGTLGYEILNKVEYLQDVQKLVVSGTLNDEDIAILAKLVNIVELDMSGSNLTTISGCKDLKHLMKVTLPTTAEKIGDNAFSNCKALREIKNIDNVSSIGSYAFSGTSIRQMTLPKLTEIGTYAFSGASVLREVKMPILRTISNYTFRNCSSLVDVNIPLVKSIGSNAFYGCSSLESIDITKATTLSTNAFYNCISLRDVRLANRLQEIPANCFYGCNALTQIAIPQDIQSIAQYAFTNTGLTDVNCHSIIPITTAAFTADIASKATLHVPAIALSAYKLHDSWETFGKIIALEEELKEIVVKDKFVLTNTNGLTKNPEIGVSTLGNGNNKGELIINTKDSIHLSYYWQYIGTYERTYSNDSKYYGYSPYSTSLIVNSPVESEEVEYDFVMRPRMWNFFSLPFDADEEIYYSDNIEDFVIREYSGQNRATGNGSTWIDAVADNETIRPLEANKGYILYYTNTNNYLGMFYFYARNTPNKNNLFTMGDASIALNQYPAELAHNQSWNLIGNPYPCFFDISELDYSAPITTWNGSSYVAYSPADDNYILRPSEAFFVQAAVGVDKITFKKEGRLGTDLREVSAEEYNRYRYFAPSRNKQADQNRRIYNFVLSIDSVSDRVRLVLNDAAKAEYEIERDAAKMMSDGKDAVEIYVYDNDLRYAIDERPNISDDLSLGIRVNKEGEYTLSMNTKQAIDEIWLIDTESSTMFNLADGDYIFTAKAGSNDKRFRIVKNTTDVETMGTTYIEAPTKVLENGHIYIVMPNGKKYSVGGQEL